MYGILFHWGNPVTRFWNRPRENQVLWKISTVLSCYWGTLDVLIKTDDAPHSTLGKFCTSLRIAVFGVFTHPLEKIWDGREIRNPFEKVKHTVVLYFLQKDIHVHVHVHTHTCACAQEN